MEHIFRPNPTRYVADHIIDRVFLIAFFVLIPLFLIYLYFVPETPEGLTITPLFYILMGSGLTISFLSVYIIGLVYSRNTYLKLSSSTGMYVDNQRKINFPINEIRSAIERSRIPNLGEFLKTDLPDYSISDAVSEASEYSPKPKLKNAYDKALENKLGYDVKELGDYWIEIKNDSRTINIPVNNFDKSTRKQILNSLNKIG